MNGSQAGRTARRPSSEDEPKGFRFVSVSQGLDYSLYRAKQVDAAAAPARPRKAEPSKPHRLYLRAVHLLTDE